MKVAATEHAPCVPALLSSEALFNSDVNILGGFLLFKAAHVFFWVIRDLSRTWLAESKFRGGGGVFKVLLFCIGGEFEDFKKAFEGKKK